MSKLLDTRSYVKAARIARDLSQFPYGKRILTDDQYKLNKDSARYQKVGLTLSPATEAGIRSKTGAIKSACAYSTPQCRFLCLISAGRLQGHLAAQARIGRSRYQDSNPGQFNAQVERELHLATKRARKKGVLSAARFCVTHDQRDIPAPWFNAVDQAYDYTADPVKAERFLSGAYPANYHLTFSRKETAQNHAVAKALLARGMNVAVVVRDEAVKARVMASGFWGAPCIDGDLSDNRFLDPKGHVVLLRAKGKARKAPSGFVVD